MGQVYAPEPLRIVGGWVTKDLMFYLTGPPETGPLAGYQFMLVVEGSDGETVYADRLERPDLFGRIHAHGKPLNPMGGDLILACYEEELCKIKPYGAKLVLASGRCRYRTNMSGRFLMFRVEYRLQEDGTDADADTMSRTRTGVNKTMQVEASMMPGGIGVKDNVSFAKPGDQETRADQRTQTRKAFSVTDLVLTQVAAPPARRRHRP